jgi:ABC-type nitrate/sulfonate/bicarbonate transport system substrate-binding protein
MVIVANASRIEEDPEAIRLFLRALERGTAQAIERPNAATRAVLEANQALDPKTTRAQVKVTLPLLADDQPNRPFGHMDTARWQTFINWAVENEVLASPQRAVDALTNALLPTDTIDVG